MSVTCEEITLHFNFKQNLIRMDQCQARSYWGSRIGALEVSTKILKSGRASSLASQREITRQQGQQSMDTHPGNDQCWWRIHVLSCSDFSIDLLRTNLTNSGRRASYIKLSPFICANSIKGYLRYEFISIPIETLSSRHIIVKLWLCILSSSSILPLDTCCSVHSSFSSSKYPRINL